MTSIERPHIPEEELHAYCDGELSPAQRMEIAEHLLGCLICRALHDEVETVRARTAALLEFASPPGIRRREMPRVAAPARRRDAPRIAAAIAAAVVGAGLWFSFRPSGTAPGSQLATSLIAPDLGVVAPAIDASGQRARQLTLSNRLVGVPGVRPAHTPTAVSFPRTVAAAVDPVVGDEWPETAVDSAVRAGAIPTIAGLAVTSVRTHRGEDAGGIRPTALVRQQLADGRSIWVFEGLEEDFASVSDLMQASGITVSVPIHTRPDYVFSDQSRPTRTVRMAAVAGYLPADSLNVLLARVDVP